MFAPVQVTCPKCGLLEAPRFECLVSGEEIDVFEDDDSDAIVDKEIHRHLATCDELDWKEDVVVDSDPDHSLDFLISAVSCYARDIGLDKNLVEWQVLKIGGRFEDCVSYGDFYIGHTFSECVEELDKAAAGQPYGTPLENWEK